MTKPTSYSAENTVAAIRSESAKSNDYRALVCVFLFGGNDSHNMIIPRNGTPNRVPYDTERGVLAVTDSAPNLDLNTNWRLHPSLADIKTLYDAGNATVLMNVGYLAEPTNRVSYLGKTAKLPPQLFSHNNQQQLWQSLPPLAGLAVNGWMGRAADLAESLYNPSPTDGVSSLFSVAGRQTQMQGFDAKSSDMNTSGPQIIGTGDARTATGFPAALLASRTRQEWENVLQKTLAQRMASAVTGQAALAAQLQALPTTPNNRFDALASNSLAQQLRVVARIIHSRSNYAHRRDMFFVSLGGWDDHDALTTAYGPRLQLLDDALFGFWNALGDLGVQKNVTTFTETEFGRALKANVNGSDHGWGSHQLVIGGSVNGGVIYGTPPDLANGSSNDAGQGRMIPTTSAEQYAGTMLEWWGIPAASLPVVLENIDKFPSRTLPMLKAPGAPVTELPVLSLNFLTGKLDTRVVHTRGSLATQFDKNGDMVVAPCNLLTNTAMENAVVGILGSGGSLPTGWNLGTGPTGMVYQVKALGVLPTGEKFIDFRAYGTNNTGSIQYAALLACPTLGVLARNSERLTFSAKGALIGDLIGAEVANVTPVLACAAIDGGGVFVANNVQLNAVAERQFTQTFKRCVYISKMPAATSVAGRFGFSFTIPIGHTFDFTLRIVEPHLEYSLEGLDANVVPSGNYIETTVASGPNNGPRFDYDPVTLNPRGLLTEGGRLNNIPDSFFAGFVPGTPGTWPAASFNAGYSTTTGVGHSIVRKGIEKGIPFIDVRVFGTAVGTGSMYINGPSPFVAFTAAQNPGPRYTFSAYMALKSGVLPVSNVRVIGNVAGAYNSQAISADFALTLKDAPLSHQRVQASMQMSGATLDSAYGGWIFTLTNGVAYDFTIRIGAPQFESGDSATSFMPTFGGIAARNADTALITGAAFTGVFNAVAGTFVNKFSHALYAAATYVHYGESFSANSGSSANRVSSLVVSNLSRAGADVTTGSVSQFNVSLAAPLAKPGEDGTLAVGYALNNMNAAYKGALAVLDASATLPIGINRLVIGSSLPSWSKSLDYYNVRLTDAQLTLLSST